MSVLVVGNRAAGRIGERVKVWNVGRREEQQWWNGERRRTEGETASSERSRGRGGDNVWGGVITVGDIK